MMWSIERSMAFAELRTGLSMAAADLTAVQRMMVRRGEGGEAGEAARGRSSTGPSMAAAG